MADYPGYLLAKEDRLVKLAGKAPLPGDSLVSLHEWRGQEWGPWRKDGEWLKNQSLLLSAEEEVQLAVPTEPEPLLLKLGKST